MLALGHWADEFRGLRQTGDVARAALAYNPRSQQTEKRLAKCLAFDSRINARRDGPLHRKVSTLLENAVLLPAPEHPERARRRLEKALDQLAADGVIAQWQYVTQEPLPARNWLQRWTRWTVAIEPPMLVRERYAGIRKS